MNTRLIVVTFVLLAAAGDAAALNEHTTIVLHAVDTAFIPCHQIEIDGTDCDTVLPRVDLTGMQDPSILVLLRNHDDAQGMQCAFLAPIDWVFAYGLWNCLDPLPESNPGPPWGPLYGTVSLAFGDPIVGGELTALGRMHFAFVSTGCLEIVESSFPYGTHVVSSGGAVTPIHPANRARICVGPGGYDACQPAAVPARAETWGRIKSAYTTR